MDFSSSTFGGESLAIFTDKGVKVLMGVGDMIVIKEAFDHAWVEFSVSPNPFNDLASIYLKLAQP